MKKALYIVALYGLPMLAVAATTGTTGTFGSGGLETYMGSVSSFLSGKVVPFIIVIALVVFIWGMFTYFILGGSDEEKQKSGKQLMIWGIVGFVLIISVQGIVTFLAQALGFSGGSITAPTILPQ